MVSLPSLQLEEAKQEERRWLKERRNLHRISPEDEGWVYFVGAELVADVKGCQVGYVKAATELGPK